MNERIKELYEQSLTHTTGKDHAGNPMAIIKQNPELFAELIVRECADIATINSNQWHSAGTYVLKHFGVEK